MRDAVQKEMIRIRNSRPESMGNTYWDVCAHPDGSGTRCLVIADCCMNTLEFTLTETDIDRLYGWLANRLVNALDAPEEFQLGEETATGRQHTIGIVPFVNQRREYRSEYWKRGCTLPWSACCVCYLYDVEAKQLFACTFDYTESLIGTIYTLFRDSKRPKQESAVIESYFRYKEPIRLEYKGYSTVAKIESSDLRYHGTFIAPDGTDVSGKAYTGNHYPEVRTRFEAMVDEVVAQEE